LIACVEQGLVSQGRVYLCGMNRILVKDLESTDALIRKLRTVKDLSVEQGGWRVCTLGDVTALTLADTYVRHFDHHPGELCPALAHRMDLHPAWSHGLEWMCAGPTYAVTAVLAAIYDPYRFSDKRGMPSSLLRSFFRLSNASGVRATMRGWRDQSTPPQYMPTANLMQAWLCSTEALMLEEHVAGHPEAWVIRDYFHYREKYAKRGKKGEDLTAMALWRATIRFLDFIRFTWLQGLGVPGAFDPIMFFKQPDEASAYLEFIATVPKPGRSPLDDLLQ
jgi:hypothetical protein